MFTQVLLQPPLIDPAGNIVVNGRSSIWLPVKSYADVTKCEQIDISTWSLYFEINGVLAQRLTSDPNDPFGLVLDIPDLATAGITITSPRFPLFVLRNQTGSQPGVIWQGQFIVTGYENAPTGIAPVIGGISPTGQYGAPGSVDIIQSDGTVFAFVYDGPPGAIGQQATPPSVVEASPYQLTAGDLASVKVWSGSTDLTILVPNGLGAGFTCKAVATGVGAINFEATGSAVVGGAGGLSLTTPFAIAELVPIATDFYVLDLGGFGASGGQLDFSDPGNSGLIGH